MPFEKTDQDENVGVFDDGFAGFSLAPGKKITVDVRLAFTADTQPNEVTANVALVQRQNDDGEWVGESNDYKFSIISSLQADEGQNPPPTGLAKTGPGSSLLGLGATAGVFLLGGGALVVGSRRLRLRKR
ncbi:hypothetical protein P8605_19525 [Streptomyces sp. T-3]|nr:hypothetical protein [Streptomyces sp. T-3]